eukprot:gnl/TRDRNA2_/TRDRNA2_71758_c1_seq1.p1 gnl/TRDRNA2_/TRDRNA2_71758_c1~~gnl/TRDRNA2_/TRDRNA2_71758_c1_seq1.p1  ORF type:complete len:268 (-),score=43.55 gnl/TRDRNA2_/TRDRNA2_71758_c1_seq1:173-880(-)
MLTERGTRLFSAPELSFGGLWNERIDIWASGLSLYFMLKASIPFKIRDRKAQFALRSGQLPDMDWTGITPLMQNLIRQCLTVNMHDRPPAMELLLHPLFEDWGMSQGLEAEKKEQRHVFELHPRVGLLCRGSAVDAQNEGTDVNKSRPEPLSPLHTHGKEQLHDFQLLQRVARSKAARMQRKVTPEEGSTSSSPASGSTCSSPGSMAISPRIDGELMTCSWRLALAQEVSMSEIC